MNMKANITKATKKEIKAFNDGEWHDIDIEHYGKPVEWIKKEFVFKATEKGKIIGSVEGKFSAGVIYIGQLVVAKDKRRYGVGRQLMEKVEKFGKQLHAHKIFLFTKEEWVAGKFYKSLGYKKTGDLPKHYLKIDFVIYSKLINS